jgi:hypothetical protein
MKVAIAVIAITPSYLGLYYTFFYKSHEIYANKHGYDLKVIDYMLDLTVNHTSAFSFQKILVASLDWSNEYDYIICIDADIFINTNAPAIHECCDFEGKIGIVDEKTQPTFELREKFDGAATEYYKKAGLDIDTKIELNTGVMVFQPRLHGEFLRGIFDKYIENARENTLGYHYEQSTVGYEFQKNNMYKLIPSEFNAIWGLTKYIPETSHISMDEFYNKNYFIHFAGNTDWYDIPDILHKYLY